MSRKRTMTLLVAGLLTCAVLTAAGTHARADQPLSIRPAVYQAGDDVGEGAAVQLVRHGYGGYGYGWGGGYRPGYYGGWGGYYGPVYRPYPVYAAPVYAAPVYSAPAYYGYPGPGAFGYYGYGRCW